MPDEPFTHLCQPDSRKSCGACCGIYNYADSSREALVARLRKTHEVWLQAGVLSGAGAAPTTDAPALWITLGKTLLQVAAFIALMLVVGRRLLP